MSDLFHPDIPDAFIDRVFAVMALAPWHTFQVLTKRPERMREYLSRPAVKVRIGLDAMAMCLDAAVRTSGRSTLGMGIQLEATDINPGGLHTWPLPNVWCGVSVEDQATTDERIPLLLQTPAAVRWISAEPLLGPVSLDCWPIFGDDEKQLLHWVVVGGESGTHARPMHPQWARSLRDQCAAAGVAFLFKQWGEWISADQDECHWWAPNSRWMWADGQPASSQPEQRGMPLFCRSGKRQAGRLLDGVQHDGYPGLVP